ncbi:MAG: 50S ribosomal protein L1 [Candidatus Diapherotrites archaeon]|nr:50S ribosomal protein L1 [Candidatus Diapherotrites archaeon]
MKLKEGIKKAKESTKKRKFKQTVELAINFKGIDFSKAQNRLNLEVSLPKGRGKENKVAVIANEELALKAKNAADKVIRADEMEKLGKNKKEVKKIARDYDAFIAEVSLMAAVGKHLGQVLGPQGKMPKPIPPGADPAPIIKKLKGSVAIRTKGKNMPVVHAPIGTEEMNDDDLFANAQAIIKAVEDKLPQHDQNIKNVVIKTTMGPAITIDEFAKG